MNKDNNRQLDKECPKCSKPIVDKANHCGKCAALLRESTLHPPMFKTCKGCGEEFRLKPSQLDKLFFCSMECKKRFHQIECPVCSKLFKPDHPRRARNSTCSRECMGILKRKRSTYQCHRCGNEIYRPPSLAEAGRQFCSQSCNRKWQRETATGWITNGGYRMLCIDRREVFEHRYIMEQHLGRLLEDHEVAHHINGNILDNRIENLELMTKSEHSTHHNLKRYRNAK